MSAARNAEPQPLELDIFNLPFRLRAPHEEHERLQRAAKHVDTVMRELVAAQPSADTTRLAIQAAFLISSDYFRGLDESFAGPENADQVGRRVNDILRGLDIALAEMKGALRPLAEDEPRLQSAAAEPDSSADSEEERVPAQISETPPQQAAPSPHPASEA